MLSRVLQFSRTRRFRPLRLLRPSQTRAAIQSLRTYSRTTAEGPVVSPSTVSANPTGNGASMPNSAAGDAAFAAAAVSTIFGSAATATIINAIDAYVTNTTTFTSAMVPHGTRIQLLER